MYSKLHETFWGDLKRKGVSSEGKLLFAYLISCPHHNMIGLFYIPFAYVASDLCWAAETVSERFGELSSKGFISYDAEAEMVLVRNYLKHNKLDNLNVEKSAAATARQLPDSVLFQALGGLLEQFGEQYALLRETVSERYANTITITTPITTPTTIPIPKATPTPRAAPVPQVQDEGLGRVMSAYLDRVNASPSPSSLDELKGYTARLGPEVCLRAIDKGLDAGKGRWDYIRGILRRLEADGIRSVEAWEQQEAERDHKKGGQAPDKGGPVSFTEIAERLQKGEQI